MSFAVLYLLFSANRLALRRKSGQLVIDVTYGVMIDNAHHPLIRCGERVMVAASLGISPVMWLMNPVKLCP